ALCPGSAAGLSRLCTAPARLSPEQRLDAARGVASHRPRGHYRGLAFDSLIMDLDSRFPFAPRVGGRSRSVDGRRIPEGGGEFLPLRWRSASLRPPSLS